MNKKVSPNQKLYVKRHNYFQIKAMTKESPEHIAISMENSLISNSLCLSTAVAVTNFCAWRGRILVIQAMLPAI